MISLSLFQKSAFIAMCSLFIVSHLYGQADYQPGFIIDNANDTIHGLISYKTNISNSKQCVFKKSTDATAETYTPGQIKGYGIGDQKYYVSKTLHGEKIFLECLVDGIADLYYYKTLGKRKYFVDKDSLIELKSEKKNVTVKKDGVSKTYERESKEYVNALAHVFSDDPKIFAQINATSLDNRSLIKLVKDYHHDVCHEYDCTEFTKKNKGIVYIGPKISFVNATMELDGSPAKAKDASISYGFQLRYTPTSMFYRLSFISGVEFGSNSFDADFPNSIFTFDRIYRITATYSLIRIPLVIQYTIPLKHVQPIISIGYNNIFLVNRSYSVTDLTHGFNTPIPSGFRQYEYGFVGGIGLTKNISDKVQLGVKGDYEYRKSATNLNNVMDLTNVKSMMISASCLFKL